MNFEWQDCENIKCPNYYRSYGCDDVCALAGKCDRPAERDATALTRIRNKLCKGCIWLEGKDVCDKCKRFYADLYKKE